MKKFDKVYFQAMSSLTLFDTMFTIMFQHKDFIMDLTWKRSRIRLLVICGAVCLCHMNHSFTFNQLSSYFQICPKLSLKEHHNFPFPTRLPSRLFDWALKIASCHHKHRLKKQLLCKINQLVVKLLDLWKCWIMPGNDLQGSCAGHSTTHSCTTKCNLCPL